MAAVNRGELEIKYNDFSAEPTSVTFAGASTDAAGFAAALALAADLGDALNALTDGLQQRFAYTPSATRQVPRTRSTDSDCQREKRWEFTFIDDVTGLPFTEKIGTADLSDNTILMAGTDKANLSHANWVAFKDAYDAFGYNPKTGNKATFQDARFLGKDN